MLGIIVEGRGREYSNETYLLKFSPLLIAPLPGRWQTNAKLKTCFKPSKNFSKYDLFVPCKNSSSTLLWYGIELTSLSLLYLLGKNIQQHVNQFQ